MGQNSEIKADDIRYMKSFYKKSWKEAEKVYIFCVIGSCIIYSLSIYLGANYIYIMVGQATTIITLTYLFRKETNRIVKSEIKFLAEVKNGTFRF